MKTNRLAKNSMAVGLVTLIVTAGLSFSAQAADAYNSNAEAKFLTGTLGGQALPNELATLEGAAASEPATADRPEVATNPNSPIAGQLGQLGSLAGLTFGAVNNYAEAGSTPGVSRAASGAVSDAGVIDTTGGGVYPANTTLDLSEGALNGLSALTDLKLNLGAVSSSADLTAGGSADRDYNIAGAGLELTIPALATLVGGVSDALGETLGDVDNISLSEICGTLAGDTALTTLCNALPSLVDLNIQVPSLNSVLGDTSDLSQDGVTVNLETGVVTVDLDDVLSAANLGSINDLAPSTDLLAIALPAITNSLDDIVQDVVDGLVTNIADNSSITLTLLGALPLTLDANQLDALLDPLTDALTTTLGTLTPTLATALGTIVDGIAPVAQVLVNVPDLSTSLIAGTPAGTGIASQTAVQILLGNGQGADLRLANSLVGPNAVVDAADEAAADDGTPADDATPADDGAAAADDGTPADDDSQAVADADSSDADSDVARTLPDTGAPNLLPLWIMGAAFLMFGGAILLNEKRRKLLS
jgi:hypothetical protein